MKENDAINKVIHSLNAANGTSVISTVMITTPDGTNKAESVSIQFLVDNCDYRMLITDIHGSRNIEIRVKRWWIVKLVKAITAITGLFQGLGKGIKITRS